MVAANDDHLATGRGVGDAAEEGVVELLGAVARGGGVENVAGNQQGVDVRLFNPSGEPVEEGGKFVVAPAAAGLFCVVYVAV